MAPEIITMIAIGTAVISIQMTTFIGRQEVENGAVTQAGYD